MQNAYTLTFGGLLLLGARAGDILGRRRVFVAGIALFTVASMMGGLAQSASWLLAARAVQGVGAAIAAPSTLALLQISFRGGTRADPGRRRLQRRGRGWRQRRPRARRHAHHLDLVAVGAVHQRAHRRRPDPPGAPRYLPETERRPGHFDLAGAVTSTLGMTLLVYGFVRAPPPPDGATGSRWPRSSLSAALLATFVVTEKRAEQPITPLHLFASRQRSGAYAARMLVVSGMFAMFFFMTQFFQGVLGYSALERGWPSCR